MTPSWRKQSRSVWCRQPVRQKPHQQVRLRTCLQRLPSRSGCLVRLPTRSKRRCVRISSDLRTSAGVQSALSGRGADSPTARKSSSPATATRGATSHSPTGMLLEFLVGGWVEGWDGEGSMERSLMLYVCIMQVQNKVVQLFLSSRLLPLRHALRLCSRRG